MRFVCVCLFCLLIEQLLTWTLACVLRCCLIGGFIVASMLAGGLVVFLFVFTFCEYFTLVICAFGGSFDCRFVVLCICV